VLERLLTSLLLASAARPRLTLLLLAGLSLLLAGGVFELRFETGLSDWLPASDPDVQAFDRLVANVDGVTNQELVWLELDPEKAAALGVEDITDEAAIRAQEEFARFVTARVPQVRFTFGLPYWLELARSVTSGKTGLPESSLEFTVLWNAVWRTQQDLLSALLSRDRRAALLGFVIEGNPLSEDARQVGTAVARAVAAYVTWQGKRFDLFRDELLMPVGLASGMADVDRQLRRDLARLLPPAALLMIALLAIAFRNLLLVLLAAATLGLGLLWTYGLMGWLGVGLNIVNIVLFPLILGTGIDYAIHFLNAVQAEARHQPSAPAVFAGVARRTGVPLVLATLTTVAGLLALTLSGVPGMVELGLLSAFGMAMLLLLVLSLLPAALALSGGTLAGGRYRPSRRLARFMTAVQQRYRRPTIALLMVAGAAALFLPGGQRYQLDVIQGNFTAAASISRAITRIRQRSSGAFPEFVIFSGAVDSPEFLRYAGRITERLEAPTGGLGAATRVIGPDRILGSYQALKDGAGPALARFLAAGGDLAKLAPSSGEEIRGALTAMHHSQSWAPLAKLITSETLDLATLIVLPGNGAVSRRQALELTQDLRRAIDGVDADRPVGVTTHFLGYRTISDLFIRTSLRWLRILSAVALAGACLLVLAVTRRWRPTLAVALTMGLAGAWWYRLLPALGIFISIFLLFPLIFLISIGSDYAIHLTLARARGDAEAYQSTGKAVLFSLLTDLAVFLIFTFTSLVSVDQVMRAASLAALTAFIATVLVVPLIPGQSGERQPLEPQ